MRRNFQEHFGVSWLDVPKVDVRDRAIARLDWEQQRKARADEKESRNDQFANDTERERAAALARTREER